jgi:hypothetical protein
LKTKIGKTKGGIGAEMIIAMTCAVMLCGALIETAEAEEHRRASPYVKTSWFLARLQQIKPTSLVVERGVLFSLTEDSVKLPLIEVGQPGDKEKLICIADSRETTESALKFVACPGKEDQPVLGLTWYGAQLACPKMPSPKEIQEAAKANNGYYIVWAFGVSSEDARFASFLNESMMNPGFARKGALYSSAAARCAVGRRNTAD